VSARVVAPAPAGLTHASGKRGAKKVALVGKGITFDTGGISIKPAASMHHMTSDMGARPPSSRPSRWPPG
jgi:leucyl aminopeptidase